LATIADGAKAQQHSRRGNDEAGCGDSCGPDF
jgi:hypothetical protein